MPRIGGDNGKAMFNLRFSCNKAIEDAVREYAERKGLTISDVIRDAIQEVCDVEEKARKPRKEIGMLTARIPSDMLDKIDVIAAASSRSRSSAVAEIIRRYLFE